MTRLPPIAPILRGMAPGTRLAPVDDLAAKIHTDRGVRVMLDSDLAALYGVETRVLNQAVRRNAGRFPGDFVLHLSYRETKELQRSRSQSVILSRGGNIKYRATAFTEHGAVMAATVLNSPTPPSALKTRSGAPLPQRNDDAACGGRG
jgi:hypothetical protein